MPHIPRLRIGIVLLPSFSMTPLSALIDVLRLAADNDDRSRSIDCSWTIVGERSMRSSAGVRIAPDVAFCEPERFDYVVVCGGLLEGHDFDSAPIEQFVRRATAAGVPLVGLCTGSFLLARMGLMAGRTTCVSWFHQRDFVAEFPHLRATSEQIFLIDGNRITCAGGAAAIHLGLALVARHCGPARLEKVRRIMQVESPQPASAPQPQPMAGFGVADTRTRRAMLFIEQRLSSPPSTDEIARHVHTSERHLSRLFRKAVGQSPAQYVRRLRLDHARTLLRETCKSISEVALDTGFVDCSHFCRAFRSTYGVSPGEARQRPARLLPLVGEQLQFA